MIVMPLYELEWASTMQERYDTDMNERARGVVTASGVTVVDDYGGTDGTGADNGFTVETDEPTAIALAQSIADQIGKPVGVTLAPEEVASYIAVPKSVAT